MDVSKMREVFMKSLNERKAVKKETKPGTSEFTPVLDQVKSKENETKPIESDELNNKSQTETVVAKEENTIDAEDSIQNTEEKDNTKVETPILFQPSILNLIQIIKSENSEEADSKISKLIDVVTSTKVQGNTENKELSLLMNFLKQTSDMNSDGQPVSPEIVQGKLNDLTDMFEGMAPDNILERIKRLLTDANDGEGKPVFVEGIKSDSPNIENMIKSELAQILKAKKEIKSPERKEPEIKIDNLNISKDKDSLLAQSFTSKIEKEVKIEEGFSVKLNVAGNTEDKEEKLLKSLLSDDKTKGHKDTVNDKLFNFLTHFDSVNSNSEVKLQEGFTVNKNNLSQDMIKAVKFMQVNDLKDLTVKIAPKELGEVIIKLTMDKGVMKASLSTTNKEAYSILNSNLADMNQKLSHSDIKIQEFSINIYNGDTTFFSEEFNKQNQQQQDRNSSFKTFTQKDDNILAIDENTTADTSNVNILA